MAVKPRRAEHVEDTRAALVRAARTLFTEQGYAATGTEEVVARARVTRGALYHHFRDKADLFRAVMHTVAGEVAEQLVAAELARAGQEPVGAWEQLRHGVQAYLDACVDSEFQRIVLVEGPAVLGREAWEALVEQHGHQMLRTWLDNAIQDGQIDPLPLDPLPRLLGALLAEASTHIARSADRARARDETGRTVDRILAGLRPGSAHEDSP